MKGNMKNFRTMADLVTTVWLCFVSALPAAGNAAKPNMLFIIIDQQHAGMMSCAGQSLCEDPGDGQPGGDRDAVRRWPTAPTRFACRRGSA